MYKRQGEKVLYPLVISEQQNGVCKKVIGPATAFGVSPELCLLYTSDAADERSSVDLGGRRIIKKKTQHNTFDDVTRHDHTQMRAQTSMLLAM